MPATPGDLDEFVQFCAELTSENGEALEIYPEQLTMLSDYFAGVRETLILISKKNGKSTLLAATALYHLAVVDDAECVIVAASRDQASIMLRQTQGLIYRSSLLQQMMRVKQREITSLTDRGRVRVLASDVDTADGTLPTLALVDELHRHKTADLYGVLRDGLGPRNGQLITISTAGSTEASPLGVLRDAAHQLPTLRRQGSYRHARSDIFALHEWSLDADQDLDDLELVKTANPASWMTVEALRERRDSPSMTAGQWARFACGVWVTAPDAAVVAADWERARTDDRPAPGEAIWGVGVDLGWVWDTSALCPLWVPEPDRRVLLDPVIITPPRDGSSIPPSQIRAALQGIYNEHPFARVAMDKAAGGEQLAEWIEDTLRAEVVLYTNGTAERARVAQRFLEGIRADPTPTLQHTGHPELTRHVLNAVARVLPRGDVVVDRPNQSRSAQAQDQRVIDGLTAASIVNDAAIGTRWPSVDVSAYRIEMLV
jgi:hypothetical protein